MMLTSNGPFPGQGRRPATTYWETFQLKDIRAEQGEILLCDDEPTHLMLTSDGLFEQRFPK